jgi:hypothetical protein
LKKELFKKINIILLFAITMFSTNVLAKPIVARAKINYCLADTINNNLVTIKIKGISSSNVNGIIEVLDITTNQLSSQSFRGQARDTILNDKSTTWIKLNFDNQKTQTFSKAIELASTFYLSINTDEEGFYFAELKAIRLRSLKTKKWKNRNNVKLDDCNRNNQ